MAFRTPTVGHTSVTFTTERLPVKLAAVAKNIRGGL